MPLPAMKSAFVTSLCSVSLRGEDVVRAYSQKYVYETIVRFFQVGTSLQDAVWKQNVITI